MFRKIILSTILATIFFCGQCFAAQDYPICNKNQNDFVKNFNAAANNLGFTFETPELFPMENSPDEGQTYLLKAVPDNVHALAFVITNKDNFLTVINLATDDVEIAKKMFKPALLAVGLTEKEITAKPVFKKTETLNSFWCAESKRYVNVNTHLDADNSGIFYIEIVASKDKPAK